MAQGLLNRTETSQLRAEALYKVIFLSLISILLLILEPRVAGLKFIRNTVNYTTAPLQITIDWLANQQRSVNLFLSSGSENRRLVLQLEQENLLLRENAARFQQIIRDNQQLRKLLNYKTTNESNDVLNIAKVIGGQVNIMNKEIFFDLGRVDGIKEGMTIRNSDGLLGQVILVGISSSKGLLITDPRHSVPVKVARTGHRFILDGIGKDISLQAIDLPVNIDVKEGDILLTSGLGGVFTIGIPVAEVYSVVDKPRISLRELYARPLSKPHIAEFIIVQEGLNYQLPEQDNE